MRSIVSTANGGRPVDFLDACAEISATNSFHGTTSSISSRKYSLARTPRVQIEAQVLLLHADIVLPERDVTALIGAGF